MRLHQIFTFACLVALCTWQLPTTTNAAQILALFAHPGKSHFDFFRPLLVGLATDHNLTVVSYFPNSVAVNNYNDIQLTGMPIFADIVDLKAFDNNYELIPFKVPTFFMLHEWGMNACEFALSSAAIKAVLQNHHKYDAILIEQFNNDCLMAVAYLVAPAAPVIGLSSCALMPWHYQRFGMPFQPSFMPMNFLPHTDEMNFVQRLNNFVHFHVVNMLYEVITQRATNALLRQHFPGETMPTIQGLVKNTSLMLINQHYTLTGAYPSTPNVVEVGGLQIQPNASRLHTVEGLHQLLEDSVNGVIYISWGSMIRPETLSADKLQALLHVVAQLPKYTFLLRWPKDRLVSTHRPANLYAYDWMPQLDILCHKHTKAFMTHGGLLGTSEAVYCGVPMLVTPFYGDQFLNSVTIRKRKLGIILNYGDFNAVNILQGLLTLLEPSYMAQVQQVSDAYRSRAVAPLELAVWWVEHIIATNGAPLAQNAAIYMDWFATHSMDVIAAAMVFILVFVSLFRILIKMCLRLRGTKQARHSVKSKIQ